MKKILFLLTGLSLSFAAKAQFSVSEISDRIALKDLVDTFSVLADKKETDKQTFLFTEDASVETRTNGQTGHPLKGRKQIGDAFANYLKNFETVYHINGQQTVTLNGDKASGISYCHVILIGEVNGKMMKTSILAVYNDDFVKEDGRWLIAKRVSDFVWREVEEVML